MVADVEMVLLANDVIARLGLDGIRFQVCHAGLLKAIIEELENEGLLFDPLAEEVGKDLDPFDLICHVAFDQPPRTRRERAEKVRKRNLFAQYGDPARAVIEALLDKYADAGLKSVESLEILKVNPLSAFGTPIEIVNLFGGKEHYLAAIKELETNLYQEAA